MKSLIIIEDDIRLGKTLLVEFQERGFQTSWFQTLREIPQISYQYAVIDLRLKNESGLDGINLLKKINPDIQIIILTGYGSIATTVEAMKRGAKNYIIKPASIEKIEKALLGIEGDEHNLQETKTLSQFEHEFIEYVLLQNDNNISKTAKALGLHRQSLQRKLKKSP